MYTMYIDIDFRTVNYVLITADLNAMSNIKLRNTINGSTDKVISSETTRFKSWWATVSYFNAELSKLFISWNVINHVRVPKREQ